ncbi:MAG: SLC13 family permease [Mycobacterium sp.]
MQVVAAIIVVITLAVIVSGRAPAVLCLVCALVVAGFLGIAKPSELFAGLSNGGVITIAAMLVIAKGVFYTGVVSRVMYRLLSGVDSVRETLVRLIPPVGVLSGLINTTPIMAMLIPATKELEQQSGIPARGVLLPVAHATTLAGSATLIGTSSNLLIAGIAKPLGVNLSMFSFVPVAVPVALAGWAVLLLTAPLLVREQPKAVANELIWRAEIPLSDVATSIGRTAGDLGIDRTPEFQLEKIRRPGEKVATDAQLEAGDVLVYRATEDGVRMLWGSPRFGLARQDLYLVSFSNDEPTALQDLEEDEEIMVVAAQTAKSLRKSTARPGEMCLVTAQSAAVLTDHPLVGLWQKVAGKAPQTGKTTAAMAILLGVILCSSFGVAPVELIATAGATLMVLTRVLTPRSAARALNWNLLAIIAGSIGLGTIVVKSGLGETISRWIITLSGGQAVLIALVFAVVTTVITNVVTNAAAAAILTPVAVEVAQDAGLNPAILLILIGTCISLTFLNPIAHQTNLMVMGPGGYSTKTFVRFGIPVTIVALAVGILMGTLLLK